MKLTEKDLDPVVLEKLDRLEGLVKNFPKDDAGGYVAFNGREFFIKRINDINLRKIISESELNKHEEYFFKETKTIKNSFDSNFNINNRSNKNLRTQVVELQGTPLLAIDNQFRLSRKEKNYILLLDSKGIFYKFNLIQKRLEFSLDIISKIKTLFAIEHFGYYDIINFEIFRDGFLFSTKDNGIFFADVMNNNLEILFPENNIKAIRDLGKDKILLISDRGTIIIYDFNSGLKTDTFNQLKRLDQEPKKIIIDDDKIMILGKNRFNNSNENILHIWKKDSAGIEFQNISNRIFPGPGSNSSKYEANFISNDENNIYISGLKNQKNLFVWKYDLNNLANKFQEIIIDNPEFDQLDFVKIYEDEVVLGYKKKILFLDKNKEIVKNLSLTDVKSIDDIYFEKGEKKFLVVSDTQLISFKLPEYNYESTFTASLYNGPAINNIEIYIASSTGKEDVVLVDGDTSMQIIPSYYLTHNGNTFIKVLGSIKNLTMKINLLEDTEIKRMVVNADKIYLK